MFAFCAIEANESRLSCPSWAQLAVISNYLPACKSCHTYDRWFYAKEGDNHGSGLGFMSVLYLRRHVLVRVTNIFPTDVNPIGAPETDLA